MRLTLTSILLLTFFAAPLSAQELTGTLQQIQESGKIKIGYRQSQPPMSFLGEDGTPAGYSIDICKHIVAEVKKKVGGEVDIEYVPVTAKERFSALQDNRIDILCGSTTKTLSRGELVDFTQLTFVTGASLMTLREREIGNDFNGRKIGVVKGTTTIAALEELLQGSKTSADVVLLNTTAEGLKALEEKTIDAFAADQVVLIGLASGAEDPKMFTLFRELFSYEPFALAVRRNDADFRLVADRAISALYRSKDIRIIFDKWVGKYSATRPSAFEALVKINATPE
jgi:glutamate/aspartate transport system substrate-binding protein